jgi:hypothetical protein
MHTLAQFKTAALLRKTAAILIASKATPVATVLRA